MNFFHGSRNTTAPFGRWDQGFKSVVQCFTTTTSDKNCRAILVCHLRQMTIMDHRQSFLCRHVYKHQYVLFIYCDLNQDYFDCSYLKINDTCITRFKKKSSVESLYATKKLFPHYKTLMDVHANLDIWKF